MNRQNFDIPGGFPLETDTLDEMQKAYSLLNALGEIAGDKAILKGCRVDAKGKISDGVVYVGGEVLEFRGGVQQDSVVIKEDKTSKVFEDGEAHEVLCERYMVFGSGEGALKWNEFKRYRLVEEVAELKADMDGKFTDINGQLSDVDTKLAGKAPLKHNHDDRYYTQSQVDKRFEVARDGKESIGSEDLIDIYPKLNLFYFKVVKNKFGCAIIKLEGIFTEYDSTYGFINLLTLPEGFWPYEFVDPVLCFMSPAYSAHSWSEATYEFRPLAIISNGLIQIKTPRQITTKALHIKFSTTYII